MNFIMAFIGGGFGALTRYTLSLVIPSLYKFPFSTLCANFIGCFIASAVFTLFILKTDINTMYKTLLITGFCGGLTTLSALSLEIMEFIQSGDYVKAILYIITSVIACLVSVILGMLLVKKYV